MAGFGEEAIHEVIRIIALHEDFLITDLGVAGHVVHLVDSHVDHLSKGLVGSKDAHEDVAVEVAEVVDVAMSEEDEDVVEAEAAVEIQIDL